MQAALVKPMMILSEYSGMDDEEIDYVGLRRMS